jgi:transcriptional regulator with XRE-family HTH domain
MTLGDRIRLVRELVPKRTQEEFAKILGLSRGSVGNWETGSNVTGGQLMAISDHLGIELEWLKTGTGEMMKPGAAEGDAPPETDLKARLAAAETKLAVAEAGLQWAKAALAVARKERVSMWERGGAGRQLMAIAKLEGVNLEWLEEGTGVMMKPGVVDREAVPSNIGLEARLALAEAELRATKDMLAEVRQSRDDWRAMALRAQKE